MLCFLLQWSVILKEHGFSAETRFEVCVCFAVYQGWAHAFKQHAVLKIVIGFCMNSLKIRKSSDGQPTSAEVLGRWKASCFNLEVFRNHPDRILNRDSASSCCIPLISKPRGREERPSGACF